MTATAPPTATSQPTIGFANLARSEWTKLRSVRSTYWTALTALTSAIAIAAIICARMASLINAGKDSADSFDPTTFSLNGLYIAQIAAGALGVLVISSEYGTGMIRATLSAVPQRLAVLGSKVVVFGLATLVLGEVMSFAAFGLGQALLAHAHAGVSLTDPSVLRAVIGGGLYLTVVGLLGSGLGALIRHSAGALSAFFGILFATSVIIDILPSSWHNAINYMPANAGAQIFAVQHTTGSLSPWAGFGLLCLYAAAAIGAAAAVITRRDT
jgi:ABC-2 type transport system permease protein